MHPDLYLFGYKLLWYDIMVHLSVTVAAIYLYVSLTRISLKRSAVLIYLAVGYPVQYFGGKVIPFFYYLMHNHNLLASNRLWTHVAGRFFHSVLLSMLIYNLLACKVFRWPVRKVLDRFIIGVMLASAIGRIGCLLQGCCAGKPCDLPWAIHVFPKWEIARQPSQVYMIVAETALAFFLLSFIKKQRYDGQTFWLACLLYCVYRFLVEFTRSNPVALFGLTHAQLFSIFGFAFSACVLFYFKTKPPRAYEK